jgi:PRTRC genetic system protein C
MKVTALPRNFSYAGVTLPDPNPGLSVDQVRDVLSDDEADVAALVDNTLRADMSAGEKAAVAHALVLRVKGDKDEAAGAALNSRYKQHLRRRSGQRNSESAFHTRNLQGE